MVNMNVVVGTVAAVVNTERSDYLIVDDNSNPQYPGKVACEFYGPDNKKKLQGIGHGELVRVTGSSRSREHQGKWYTNFSAFSVTRLTVPTPTPLREPGSDEMPF